MDEADVWGRWVRDKNLRAITENKTLPPGSIPGSFKVYKSGTGRKRNE